MNVNPSTLEITATVIFALAVIHTFIASKFQQMAHHYPTGSIMENLFHFLGEVEAVFGMWAAVFLVSYAFIDPDGWRTYKMLEDGSYFLNDDGAHVVAGGALKYLMSVNFTEPAFVFVIMAIENFYQAFSITRPKFISYIFITLIVLTTWKVNF